MTPAARRGWMRWAFAALGLAFVALALWRTWDESRQQLLPDLGATLAAGLLVVGGLTGGGLSWIALFGPDAPRRLVTDFYLAQLAKYIPGGGIWQAAGQVGLSTSHGVTATRATANLVLHAGIQLVSALTARRAARVRHRPPRLAPHPVWSRVGDAVAPAPFVDDSGDAAARPPVEGRGDGDRPSRPTRHPDLLVVVAAARHADSASPTAWSSTTSNRVWASPGAPSPSPWPGRSASP